MLLCAAAFARAPVPDPVALRDRVLPLVEEVAGRKFTSPPPVVVLRTPVQRLRAYGMVAMPMAPAAAGKYALFEGTVCLVPDGLENAARSLRGRGFEVEPDALAECVLAHELVHALQHDAFEQALQRRDREASSALNMIAEGHATWVHEQVCARLHHPELVAPMRVLLGVDGDPPTACAVGLAFVEQDPTRIWSVLADPPPDTLGVWFPERLPAAAWPPGVDERLRSATSSLASVVVDRIGYDALFRELGGTGPTSGALDGFRGALQAAATDGRATVVARRITFSSPESAVDARAPSAGAEVHTLTLVQAERREELVQAALATLAGP